MTRILLVEDEPAIREMIRYALDREGFDVVEAQDVVSARREIADQRPDLAIVDWMLPETSGIEFIRTLRNEELYREMPVIMLTARAEEYDKVKGLDSGADDYMTKPVSLLELFSRINALLRRARGHAEEDVLKAGQLTMDLGAHTVSIGDKTINMGHTEFKLLEFFMSHPDRVYSRAKLLDFVWGQSVYVEERTVDVHILRLRKVLKPFGLDAMVQTVRGAGYRFSESTG
ncbi:MAG: phosphate regulon transcriptional regulator PhoB [Gammaproteobacteria bacterium]|nr:phosphate regulon transcriptional regulator PhoB [Gammaproteobacteria bacterium]